MSLILPGGQPNSHRCNAYCLDDVHAQVFYRGANDAEVGREVQAGHRVLLYGHWARIVSVQAAPEAPDPTAFTARAKQLWFFRWDGP